MNELIIRIGDKDYTLSDLEAKSEQYKDLALYYFEGNKLKSKDPIVDVFFALLNTAQQLQDAQFELYMARNTDEKCKACSFHAKNRSLEIKIKKMEEK